MTATVNVGELHGSVVAALGTGIVSGRLAIGDVITLDGIGAEYTVSRGVAREAIRVLESMGLVASRRRVGITIQPRERWNVFDPRVIRWRLDAGDRAAQLASLSELRRGFEPIAAALAARRADGHHCRILAAAVSDMAVHARSGDLEQYLLADKIFHKTLLEASGNEMLRSLYDVVAEVLTGRTHHGMMPTTPNPVAVDLHDEVSRAIRRRDAEGAERAMRAIIDEAASAVGGERTQRPTPPEAGYKQGGSGKPEGRGRGA
ncbi:FadR/GntR family transcriptional regulator [Aldersonia kunmingensis]|uniref:FadR/GntR family transcriptional regulator n=1 Tax=Aldersonia kunmingensis TaxID=408066 RepID=UPI000A06E347|nr:FCD domain-containing protein [Aldersonia kunmingensis]